MIIEEYDSTRLIGFRTTKECRHAKTTKSIQPIYYSRNEQICKNLLKPVTENMAQELPEYGSECNNPLLINIMSMSASLDAVEATQEDEVEEEKPVN